MIRRATLLAACLLACLALPARAQIIQNGSFETGNSQPPAPSLWAGGATFLGWTVTGACIQWLGGVGSPAYDGFDYLNLTCDGIQVASGVQQTFATIPGASYDLRFAFGAGKNVLGQYPMVFLTVNVAGQTHQYQNQGGGGLLITWNLPDLTFVANATSTTVSFVGGASNTNDPVFLDAVSVSQVITVPTRAGTWGRLKTIYR